MAEPISENFAKAVTNMQSKATEIQKQQNEAFKSKFFE